jgi:hypothetical protein
MLDYLPESLGTNGDGDGGTSVDHLLATDETVGTVHGNATDSVLTEVLRDLEDEAATLGLGLALDELDVESVKDSGELVTVELDVDDGTNDGLDLANLVRGGGSVRAGSLD